MKKLNMLKDMTLIIEIRKTFLVQWLQLPVDPRATPQNQGQIGVIPYPE